MCERLTLVRFEAPFIQSVISLESPNTFIDIMLICSVVNVVPKYHAKLIYILIPGRQCYRRLEPDRFWKNRPVGLVYTKHRLEWHDWTIFGRFCPEPPGFAPEPPDFALNRSICPELAVLTLNRPVPTCSSEAKINVIFIIILNGTLKFYFLIIHSVGLLALDIYKWSHPL